MNDNERENLVGMGQAVAGYAIFRANDNMATAAMENAVVQGLIEGEHTRSIVTRNTGDARLGARAGLGAQGRTTMWWALVFGLPAVLFMIPVILGMAVPSIGVHPGFFCFVWLPLCFGVMCWMGVKMQHAAGRNAYTRANLPSEKELNKSGYWQVEPDVWFNPITQAVLYGHAWVATEAVQRRQAYRSESQQIRDLYRQQRGGGGLSSLLGPGANVGPQGPTNISQMFHTPPAIQPGDDD